MLIVYAQGACSAHNHRKRPKYRGGQFKSAERGKTNAPGAARGQGLGGAADLKGGGNGPANLLIGNKGDNTFNGGFGDDDLRGGRGDDVLAGNQGDDTLMGANGDDTFAFGSGFGDDTILDFTPGGAEDVLKFPLLSDLSDLTVNSPSGNTVVTVNATGDTVTLQGVAGIDTGTDIDFA